MENEILKVLLAEEVYRYFIAIIGMAFTAGVVFFATMIGQNIVVGMQIRRSKHFRSKETDGFCEYKKEYWQLDTVDMTKFTMKRIFVPGVQDSGTMTKINRNYHKMEIIVMAREAVEKILTDKKRALN